MTIAIASPVTGVALTGLTSPMYTIVEDGSQSNAKAYVVTALGGTQTNVRTHSVSDRFSVQVYRPAVLRALPRANPLTGVYGTIPKNVYNIVIKKGVKIDAAGVLDQMTVRVSLEIPAGADSADAINIRAALAFLFGIVSSEPNDFGDLAVLGTI